MLHETRQGSDLLLIDFPRAPQVSREDIPPKDKNILGDIPPRHRTYFEDTCEGTLLNNL